jgi:hypothetical protein
MVFTTRLSGGKGGRNAFEHELFSGSAHRDAVSRAEVNKSPHISLRQGHATGGRLMGWFVANDLATWLAGLLGGAGQATLLQAQRAGIAAPLAVLDDADLTGAGELSAAVRGVPGEVLAGDLVQAVMLRGCGGGPLAALADQLHHDVTRLQVQCIVGTLPNWGIRCKR